MTTTVLAPESRRADRGVSIWPLVRLAARRDRLMIACWYVVLLGVLLASATSVVTLYASEADRITAADAINSNPGLVALYGPILDVTSVGELSMTKMTVLYAVFVAIMMVFVVRRHTRGDEEGGQAELLGGAALRQTAPLTAAVVHGAVVSLLLGMLTVAVNISGGLPAVGSFAFGASWAGIGLVATGLTAAACQLSASARTCAWLAFAAIAVWFLLRAVGDTTAASWLSWLSPFGWNTQLSAYSGTRWWVLLLYPALAGGLTLAAYALRQRRDLGSGMLQARPGPAHGSPRLASAIALSLRVNLPTLVGWMIALAVMGVVWGALLPSFDAFATEGVKELLGRLGGAGAFRDTMLGAVISVVALLVTCFAVALIVRGGADEHDGRTEQVLATATSRSQAFAATVIVALGGATWLLFVAGVALAIGTGAESQHSPAYLAASALAQAPAVWAVVGMAVLCFALGSRFAVLGWGLVVLFATLGQIGSMLNLPEWVLGLSPYRHAPLMPAAGFELLPALVLTAVALAALTLAWLRYRARDIG